ncbi:uncharacterized protein LOC144098266 [Amblyomma americanum]
MPRTAESTLSPPESAVMNTITEPPQDIPRPAEKGNGESMEADLAAAKRRRDDVAATSPEERQRPLQSRRDAGEVKKQRVTSGPRSSSLPSRRQLKVLTMAGRHYMARRRAYKDGATQCQAGHKAAENEG